MWVYLGLYKAYIGIMEKSMETTGVIGVTWSLLRVVGYILGQKNLQTVDPEALGVRSVIIK